MYVDQSVTVVGSDIHQSLDDATKQGTTIFNIRLGLMTLRGYWTH